MLGDLPMGLVPSRSAFGLFGSRLSLQYPGNCACHQGASLVQEGLEPLWLPKGGVVGNEVSLPNRLVGFQRQVLGWRVISDSNVALPTKKGEIGNVINGPPVLDNRPSVSRECFLCTLVLHHEIEGEYVVEVKIGGRDVVKLARA